MSRLRLGETGDCLYVSRGFLQEADADHESFGVQITYA